MKFKMFNYTFCYIYHGRKVVDHIPARCLREAMSCLPRQATHLSYKRHAGVLL